MAAGMISYENFYDEFMEQVNLAKENMEPGYTAEDYFTAVMFDYLADEVDLEDPIVCSFRDRALQLNGYAISEDNQNVDIYVSIFEESEAIKSVPLSTVDVSIKRAANIFRSAIREKLFTRFEKDNDTYEFASRLYKIKDEVKKLQIILLTNGRVKQITLDKAQIEGTEVSFSIWDMDRLYRCLTSGNKRETIEVDFENNYSTSIPCIENKTNDIYSVYLAIISGELLAKVYKEYGPRLLERNVRSFLSVRGNINKGIRDTLKETPEMFLAYNNGISVTAESVEVKRDENGNVSITKIRDMQIVNGGQTTASIYNSVIDKKINADLSKVFVQMKLTVIKSIQEMDIIVPKISEYANSQNKIQMADFSANDPFHRKLEDLSRTIWTPGFSGSKPVNWFYERARGQYTDALAKEGTPKKKKDYKLIHPYFTKTDLAKYENSWNQLPYQVSEGAQKNFKKFTVQLKEKGKFTPDENYYKLLIAKAILFRHTEKLVKDQNFGGYRANIVTYTIAFLSNKTGQRIDLERIWREQQLTTVLQNSIKEISNLIHKTIINPPGGANISEWCKKKDCWDFIKNIDYKIPEDLSAELLKVTKPEYVVSANTPVSGTTGNPIINEGQKDIIDKVAAIPGNTWLALSKWAKETNNFQGWQRGILFSVGTLINRGRKPSYKQAVQADKVYNEAIEKGFKDN